MSRHATTRALILAALAVGFCTASHAQWTDPDGEPYPDTSWRKSDGDFGAMLRLSTDIKSLIAAWEGDPRPPMFTLPRSPDETPRGAPIAVYVIFSNCTPDGQGLCHLTVDYPVRDPNGKTVAQQSGLELWNRRAPARNHLEFGWATMVAGFAKNSRPGIHEIQATLHDHNSGLTMTLSRQIRVLKKKIRKR